MSNTAEEVFRPQVSDETVEAKTGKRWDAWFALLDEAGAAAMSHKEIVALVGKQPAVSPWWQQMVTVTYEQARGLRQKHQMTDGYQVGASKTIGVPLRTLYEAWHDEELRRRWLPDAALHMSKATPDRSLRIAWGEGTSRVDVNLYAKGQNRSQVQLQHSRLDSAEQAQQMKDYWTEALAHLKAMLED